MNALLLAWFFGSMAVAFGAWFATDRIGIGGFKVFCWATDSAIAAAGVTLGAVAYEFATLGAPK